MFECLNIRNMLIYVHVARSVDVEAVDTRGSGVRPSLPAGMKRSGPG